MSLTFQLKGLFGLIVATFVLLFVQTTSGADVGKLTCTNGAWIPDAKAIGFGLSCPLPLDGKAKSKGKTASCALKKLGVYDGTSVKKDKIAPELCGVFTQDDKAKQCKQTVKACLKNSKEYFKDSKADPDYKSWSAPYECIEKWVSKACKK